MNVKCPKCLKPIKAENLNLQTGAAVCVSWICNNFFYLEADWDEEDKRKSYNRISQVPKGFSKVPNQNELEIEIAIGVVSNGWWEFRTGFGFFIPFIFVVVLSMRATEMKGFLYFFMVMFLASAMWMIWEGFSKIINTVSVKIDATYLEISSRPINWGKHKTRRYPIDEIEHIFVSQYSDKSKNEDSIFEYAVDFSSTKEDKPIRILKQFSEPGQAWFLEYELNRYLFLED